MRGASAPRLPARLEALVGTIEGYGGRQYCKMRRPPNTRLNGRHANVIAMLPLAHSTAVSGRSARHEADGTAFLDARGRPGPTQQHGVPTAMENLQIA